MKVGIIRCMQTEDFCPGTTDFRMVRERKGGFEDVTEAIEIIGFIGCGGCPGKKALLRARELVKRGGGHHRLCLLHPKGNSHRLPLPFCRQDESLDTAGFGGKRQDYRLHPLSPVKRASRDSCPQGLFFIWAAGDRTHGQGPLPPGVPWLCPPARGGRQGSRMGAALGPPRDRRPSSCINVRLYSIQEGSEGLSRNRRTLSISALWM